MHSIWHSLAALAFTLGIALNSADGTPPSEGIQRQIDALLKHRLEPRPLPIDLPNPFVVGSATSPNAAGGPGSAARTALEATAPTNPPAARAIAEVSNVEFLARFAMRLKIGGLIRMKDQMQLVINDVPRKEGDQMSADWNNSLVNIRIVRIEPGQVTLRLQDAEMALKY